MARSRAKGSREPGQVRKEAALSGLLLAPRASLAGAKQRLTRLGTRSRRWVHGPLAQHPRSYRTHERFDVTRLKLAGTVALRRLGSWGSSTNFCLTTALAGATNAPRVGCSSSADTNFDGGRSR